MAFVAGRLASLVPVLALVLAIVFSLVRAIPGDPAVVLLGPGATQEQVAALRDQLRLDLPAPGELRIGHEVARRFAELTGGEPLVRKELPEMIARARAKEEGKRVFLKETASWCGPCRRPFPHQSRYPPRFLAHPARAATR